MSALCRDNQRKGDRQIILIPISFAIEAVVNPIPIGCVAEAFLKKRDFIGVFSRLLLVIRQSAFRLDKYQ
jgi:hypothetical protein